MKSGSFNDYLILNAILIALAAVHIIFIIVMSVEVASVSAIKVAKVNTQPAEEHTERPAIYTDGLDEEEKEEKKPEEEKTEEKKPTLEESELSKKLVENIGRLDKLRKDGQISTAEYTKLRAQIIRKYVQ